MQEKTIKLKNLSINYKHYGTQTEKPIFLILHGWGGSSDSWAKACDLLSKDLEIYALDFPGFGKSDKLKEIWKMDDYVELVEDFIKNVISQSPDSAGSSEEVEKSHPQKNLPQLNIIAHSFGGRVAIKLAAKNPDWLEKLFLCDAAGIKHPETIKQKIVRFLIELVKIFFPELSQSAGEGKKSFLTFYRRYFYRAIGAHDYYNCSDENTKRTFQNIIAEDLTPRLGEIKKMTVIIWGEKDKYTPVKDGKIMHNKIVDSKLHIIKGVGHGVHLAAPEALCRIIRENS